MPIVIARANSSGEDAEFITCTRAADPWPLEYWVERNGVEFMRIYGNFTVHDYVMQVNGLDVASIHKKWVAVRDEIGLSIIGEVDHRIVLGALIVIEHNEVTEQVSRQSGYWRQNSGGGWYYR